MKSCSMEDGGVGSIVSQAIVVIGGNQKRFYAAESL